MATAILLSESDLQPLAREPSYMDSAIDVVEQATADHHRGAIREVLLDDRTSLPGPQNVMQIRLAADDARVCGLQIFAETAGAATLPYTRFVVLLNGETRQLMALVEYSVLNPLRVGAVSGVACRHLAPPTSRMVGILGSGVQARTQLQGIQRSITSADRARVYSPSRQHREAFAREMTAWLRFPVEAVATAREATEDADIIGVATNSREPVLELDWIKSGALIISVSGGQLPATVVDGTRVVATTWGSLATRPIFAAAMKAGTFTREDLGAELGAVVCGEAVVRRDPKEIVVFDSNSRIQIWAVRIAHWAYEWALEHRVGTRFPLTGE